MIVRYFSFGSRSFARRFASAARFASFSFFAVDAAFGLYVFMLISIQQQAADRSAKVRYIQPPQARANARMHRAPEPQLLMRRSGS